MRGHGSNVVRANCRWLPVAALLALATPARAGVTVAILPDSQTVAPGAEFEVAITVTEAGSSFNAFGLVLGFDPAALSAVSISPLSDQVGGAMTEVCTNIFHDFRRGTSRDTANCSMLCAGASTSGPGEIYRLRFRASTTAQVTALTFVQQKFYGGGLLVMPVQATGAVVRIGAGQVSVGEVPGTAHRLFLHQARPNPARSGSEIRYEIPYEDHVSLDVLDIQGRLVRRMRNSIEPAGVYRVFFDGRSGEGRLLPAGVYLIRLATRAGARTTRVAMLQ